MYGISFLIPLESVFSISLGLLRPRFRLLGFFVRMCRAKALLAFIFPVPVFLNLFAAPRLVFIFGTCFSPSDIGLLVKGDSKTVTKTNHRHSSLSSIAVFASGEELS